MYDLNTITVAGRLTRDPEQGVTQDGAPKLTITIANNIGDHSNFFVCVCYGEEAIKYDAFDLKKSDPVSVSGMLRIFTPKEGRATAHVQLHQLWVQKRGPGDDDDGARVDTDTTPDPVAVAWGENRKPAAKKQRPKAEPQFNKPRQRAKNQYGWELYATQNDRNPISSEWGNISKVAHQAFAR